MICQADRNLRVLTSRCVTPGATYRTTDHRCLWDRRKTFRFRRRAQLQQAHLPKMQPCRRLRLPFDPAVRSPWHLSPDRADRRRLPRVLHQVLLLYLPRMSHRMPRFQKLMLRLAPHRHRQRKNLRHSAMAVQALRRHRPISRWHQNLPPPAIAVLALPRHHPPH